jgi:PAS domain S-box-containing protein
MMRKEYVMSSNLTLAMINNASLLLALSIIYEISYLFRIRNKFLSQAASGVLIGLIGMAIMSLSYILTPGLIFDTRSVLIGVAALTFGSIPASVAAGITIVYRLSMGGVGTATGVTVILCALTLGLLWRRFIGTKKSKLRWLQLYAFGICVHLAMLACMFLMPLQAALDALAQITVPVLVIYPVGAVLLSLLLLHQIDYSAAVKQATEAESRYKSLFYNNHAVMLLIDPESGSIIDASPASARFYGWPMDVLKTMNIAQINTLPPEELKAKMATSVANRRNYYQFKHNRQSGGPVDVEVYAGPIDMDGKKYLYSIVHDISEQSAVLQALQESEARFRTLVSHSPDMILLLSSRKITYINQAGLKLMGAVREEEMIGQPGLSIVRHDYREETSNQWAELHDGKRQPAMTERVYIKLDGTEINVEVTVVPVMFNDAISDIVFARDITERKRLEKKGQELEAQLRQQQKLEAIGTLAGGVAHEINNPLNGVMNYAQLILDRSGEVSSAGDCSAVSREGKAVSQACEAVSMYAREIIHETERISTIVKNLLQFSRQEKQSHSYASIYDIIGQTVSLVNTIIRKDQITLDIQLEEGLPDIKCRSQQIQQVIMNLLTNARDAVNVKYPEYNDNKIIRLRCNESWSDGRKWLLITVLDTGCGIPPELRERIFEPFFSTKPKDIGTGLGLSISYGIVSEHHGKITFESEVGSYTKFILELPVDNGWAL